MNKNLMYFGVAMLVVGGGGLAFYYTIYLPNKNNKKDKAVPLKDTHKITDTGKVDDKGNKLVEIVGKSGADKGMVVKGYELPKSINDNTFPLTLIVKPNGYLGTGGEAGKKMVVTKENEYSVKLSQDNFAQYESIKINALRAEA